MTAFGARPIHRTAGMAVGSPYPITLTLPRDAAWFGVARLAAAGVALNAGLTFDAIEDVKIIVTEACTYCAQRSQAGGQLLISFDRVNDSFIVTVEDRRFFNPRRRANAREVESLGVVDGLFIIRGLADDVEYSSSAANGLMLKATKAIR